MKQFYWKQVNKKVCTITGVYTGRRNLETGSGQVLSTTSGVHVYNVINEFVDNFAD